MKKFLRSYCFCLLSTAVFHLFSISSLEAQIALFSTATTTPVNLSPTARAKYDKALSLSMYDAFELKDINISAIFDTLGLISINQSLHPQNGYVFSSRRFNYSNPLNFVWNGEYLASQVPTPLLDYSNIAIILKNGSAFGQMSLDGDIIDFTTLDGKTVLLCKHRLLNSGFAECKQPEALGTVGSNSEKNFCQDSEIRILVAFNQAAANDVIDINETAEVAVNQINNVLFNSQTFGLSGKVVLSGVIQQNIALNTNLDIEDQIQEIFDDLGNERNVFQADVVMLLVGEGDLLDAFNTWGLAGGIPATFVTSWGISESVAAAAGRRTFAHEFFHILGGWHDDVPTSIAGNHRARKFTQLNWQLKQRCTIVAAGGSTDGCWKNSRIEYLSSPKVKFQGHKTGNSTRNNREAIFENFDYIANFYPDGVDQSFNWLDVIDPICTNSFMLTATATSNTPCLTAPIKYKWRNSPNGVFTTDWSNISYSFSSSYQFYFPQPTAPATSSTKHVQCYVEDATGFNTILTGQSIYYCNPYIIEESENSSALMKNDDNAYKTKILSYPNPANDGLLFIEVDASEAKVIQMEVFDIMGRLVDHSDCSTPTGGTFNFTYQSIKLIPGNYTFVFHVENESPISQLIFITR